MRFSGSDASSMPSFSFHSAVTFANAFPVQRIYFRNDSAESVPPRRPCGIEMRNEFSSSFLTGLMASLNAFRYRSMRPKLETVGLEWATFQVLRRTNASLGRKALIDDKVAADQRGHGLGVSLEVYSISDLDQKIEAVKKIESEVIR